MRLFGTYSVPLFICTDGSIVINISPYKWFCKEFSGQRISPYLLVWKFDHMFEIYILRNSSQKFLDVLRGDFAG